MEAANGQALPDDAVVFVSRATLSVEGATVYVGSGRRADDPLQGVIVVQRQAADPCAAPDFHVSIVERLMAGGHGAIRLTSANGGVLNFDTPDGTHGRFDVRQDAYR